MTSPPPASPSAALASSFRLAGVSVKLPSFWPGDVELWFSLCEAEFDACGVKRQETMFGHIARTLPPEIAQEVRDLIVTRPATSQYDTLKAAVIKRTSVSEQRRLRQLLSEEELGDRKPSQLLRQMRQLLGTRTFDESLLRQLFLQRLPTHAQSILAASRPTLALEDVAELADQILDVQPASHPIAAISTPQRSTQDRLDRLEATVKRLEDRLSSLSLTRGSRDRSHSRSRDRSPDTPGDVCWYHRKFGAKASKCNSPCSFSGNGPAQQ